MQPGLCHTYKAELLDGVHRADDTYRLALFTELAALSPRTMKYSTGGEADGDGYRAGGKTLKGRVVALDGNTATMSFDDVVWEHAAIKARGALLYNASRDDRAVAVLDFGATKTAIGGVFRVTFPAATATTALVQIG